MKKEDLGIDEHKTHYYESNTPTKVEDWFPKMKNYQYGWICPKCGAVMSPDQKVCLYCAPALKEEKIIRGKDGKDYEIRGTRINN